MIQKIQISHESWMKEKRLVYFYGKATEVIQNKQTEQTETEIIKLNSDALSKSIDLEDVVDTFKKGLSEATPESRGQLKNAVLSYIQQRLQYAPKTKEEIKAFQESMKNSVASLCKDMLNNQKKVRKINKRRRLYNKKQRL